MSEDLTFAEYALVLREDFASFVARCFCDLNPQAKLAMNWHLEGHRREVDGGAPGQDQAIDH